MRGQDPPRILVVDDDQDICRNLSDILSDLGYQVDSAYDGPSALELVRQQPYDVALLDYKMPGMDGLTLYREIKKQRAGTVSLLVTAYAGPATAEEALAAGAWKVVAKPVDFPKLLGFVDEAIGQPMVLVVDDDQRPVRDALGPAPRPGLPRVPGPWRPRCGRTTQGSAVQGRADRHEDPRRDGSEVFRMVRDANPQARTILITGHRSEMDQLIERMIAEGADAVCYKPFDVPELLAKLGRLAGADDEEAGNAPR